MTRRTRAAGLRRILFAGALALLLGTGTAARAAAPASGDAATENSPAGTAATARPGFQLPFPCGTQWQLDTWGHDPAIDMVVKGNTGSDGKPVLASAAGTVAAAYDDPGAGNVIQISHGGGWFTAYYHLKDAAGAYVDVGDKVTPATRIGRIGATGANSGDWAHLHYEQRYRESGSTTDEGDRVPVDLDGTRYTGPGEEWPSVTSKNCTGSWEDCPEGSVCFYSGTDGTGDVCRFDGDSDDTGAPDCGLRKSYFNNGTEDPGLDHVQVDFTEGGGQCLHFGWDEGRGDFPSGGRTIGSWKWRGEC